MREEISRSAGVSEDDDSSSLLLSLRSSVSTLVDRINYANSVGFSSFDGGQNLLTALGYPKNLTYQHYKGRYERGGIAKRIVNFLPNETWAGGVSIIENEDPENITEFEKQIESILLGLNVVSQIRRADILAGIGEYSILRIGVGIENDDLEKELPKLNGPEFIIYLTPYSQERASIFSRVKDASDRRWGLPEFYKISMDSLDRKRSLNQKVHWSRVIHVTHDPLESDTNSDPELKDVWNYLEALDRIVHGGARAAWKNAKQIKHLKKDPQFKFPATGQPGSIEDLREKLEELDHDLRDTLQTTGIDIDVLSTTVDKFESNVNSIISLIAGTKEYPQRILLGSERGELASTQDRKNKQDIVTTRRMHFGDPLMRQLVDRLVECGAVTTPKEDFKSVWAVEEELTEDEKGKLAETLARANQLQSQADGKILLTADEIRDMVWGIKPVERTSDISSNLRNIKVMAKNRQKISKILTHGIRLAA